MLIVLLRDAANNVVSGTPVRFAADSGSVQVVSGTTGVNGTATALLTTPGDPTKRTITVTASTGNLRDTNTVQVVGTTLSVSGVTTLRQGFPTPLTILLRDSAGAAIANHDLSGITVSSLHGNAIGSLPTTTDANGQATVVITGNVAGTDDTITVNALGATGTHTLSVSAATFALTTEPPPPVTDMPLNTPQGIKIHWDEAGVPQVGRSITFFATRGNFAATLSCPSPTPAVCMTDANGDAIASISSNSAGPTVISAVAAGASGPTTQLSIDFIATMPTSLILQATLTSLAIDQQSVITAVLRDAQGNLVKDQTVRFSLEDVSGGQISLASAVTDSFGRASTVYTASAVPSANNGVSITATAVDSLGNPIRSTILLTVAQQALFVTLGTANNVRNLSSTQYALAYSVLVTDANGTPIANATVALNISPTQYQKSFCGAPTAICPNEDGVFDPNLKNGIRDLNPQDEDINGNQRLDPGNVAAVPTTVTTDATGFAFFDVVYAKEFGGDVAGVTVGVVEVELKARTVVVGSEGSSRALFFLPGECVILTTPPFGTGMNCTDNDF